MNTHLHHVSKHCVDIAQAVHLKVSACMVMLGSNDAPKDNLQKACRLLQHLSYVQALVPLGAHQSMDYTQKSSKLYHNMAILLQFGCLQNLADVIKSTKHIETLCGRRAHKNTKKFDYLIAMDIDILAIIEDAPMLEYGQNMRFICQRLPLKTHEKACLSAYFDDLCICGCA